MFHRELLVTARYVWCHKQVTMRAQKLQQQNQTHKYQKGKIMRNTFLNYLLQVVSPGVHHDDWTF
jgi:hypothetical protein